MALIMPLQAKAVGLARYIALRDNIPAQDADYSIPRAGLGAVILVPAFIPSFPSHRRTDMIRKVSLINVLIATPALAGPKKPLRPGTVITNVESLTSYRYIDALAEASGLCVDGFDLRHAARGFGCAPTRATS